MNSEKYSNELVHETSPYLLQHAHNPVQWHAWKPETLAKAVKEDKPILVSIGYSTCHWCHVMERESFENPETAAVMNEHFINIKVDREERPDIDQIYMEAVQFLTGSGGWPLNCFLLPDGRPFYGGTYFPPVEKYGRASWSQVLLNISNAYKSQKDVVVQQAEKLTNAIRNNEKRFISSELSMQSERDGKQTAPAYFHNIKEQFDSIHGGFSGAPKFPQTGTIDLLLGIYHYQQNDEALAQALFTMRKMIRGGIYDQLRGGFARYATDAAWLIPHFEKMLYDNALLVRSMADIYRITKDEEIKAAIVETLEFIEIEMTDPDGGFYSAIDADSEGVEGKFYVWQKVEIEQILANDAKLLCEVYDVTDTGNWEHSNILHLDDSVEKYCQNNNLDFKEISRRLKEARHILLNQRNKRIRPGTDDKILSGWNSLMIASMAEAGMALEDKIWVDKAVKQHKKISSFFKSEKGQLMHTYKNGKASIPAMLDDYAFYTDALISLFHATQNTNYLAEAKEMTDYVFGEFYDESDGLFFYTGEHSGNIVRKKDFFDSATPSGNAIHCRNLMVLGIIFDSEKYSDTATRMLRSVGGSLKLYPSSFSCWAKNRMIHHYGIEEVVITGASKNDFLTRINALYSPGRVVMSTHQTEQEWPLLLNKEESEESLIYLCKDYNCYPPVSSLDEFIDLLKIKG